MLATEHFVSCMILFPGASKGEGLPADFRTGNSTNGKTNMANSTSCPLPGVTSPPLRESVNMLATEHFVLSVILFPEPSKQEGLPADSRAENPAASLDRRLQLV